jgi:hypothetical protein
MSDTLLQGAPATPWPFPPVHVMPGEPNGVESDRYYCCRCGALLKVGKTLNTTVKRCQEYRTIGKRESTWAPKMRKGPAV